MIRLVVIVTGLAAGHGKTSMGNRVRRSGIGPDGAAQVYSPDGQGVFEDGT